ncbi:MAG: glycosyltransferase family 4 protein [Candidatus Sulfopaludibacter sp.]|nr:glycosyltransferase family 4 protein [Candidatus Sulfopaludibacter sp.]
MRIAIFDYRVISTNPVGSCHLRVLKGLCELHEFTVFAVEFENPCPERIRWVKLPLPVRPYILLYALYHLLAPLAYAYQRLARGARFDLVQIVESNLLFGDISYSHFCHRLYLKRHWRETRAPGPRGLLRGLAHRAAALMEPAVYRRVRHIVAPSRGLMSELTQVYPRQKAKLRLLPNPVDTERLQPPNEQWREEIRSRQGIAPDEVVFVFVALGHFERKGLPLVLEAIRQAGDCPLRLLVAGGERGLIAKYQARVEAMGIAGRVRLEGMQRDLRPYYWAADAFILPSCYEVFPLVALEAAAAGLPLVATRVNGVEEMLDDDYNGLVIDRTADSVATGMRRIANMTSEQRRLMGDRARQKVACYGSDRFVSAWRDFYESLA